MLQTCIFCRRCHLGARYAWALPVLLCLRRVEWAALSWLQLWLLPCLPLQWWRGIMGCIKFCINSAKLYTWKQGRTGQGCECQKQGGNEVNSRITTPIFLFRDLLGRITWEMNLERWRIRESLWIFRACLLHAQEWSIPTCRKSGKGEWRPAWSNEELPRGKKNPEKRSMKEVEAVRWPVRTHKMQSKRAGMVLGKPKSFWSCLASNMKGNMKGFYTYSSCWED